MRRLLPLASALLVAACAEPYSSQRVASAPPTPRPIIAAPSPAPVPAVPQASADVRDAQQRLRALGLYDGAIDGLWGPETLAAVERYQQQQGLELTSRLDTVTLRALRGSGTAQSRVPATPVTLADPTDVRTLQNRLRQLGFFEGQADGVWGQSTQLALENFQRARGMPIGQMTTATVAAMGLDPAAFPSRTASAPAPAVSGDALEPRVIRDVQGRLRQLGFYRGRADAVWGPGTQAALERFQQSRGLEPTGQLNPMTAAALGLDPNNLRRS